MVAKCFEIGDLVWAKMKGFSHWPGKISAPENEKVKKSHHFVFFFGSDNCAWISDENIELHNETLVEKYAKNQKRSQVYLKAVDQIVSASKGSSKYLKDFQTSYEENHSSFTKSLSSVSRKRKVSLQRPSFEKYSKMQSSEYSLEIPPPKNRKNNDSQPFNFIPSTYSHEGLGYSDDNDLDSVPGILSRNVYKERPKSPPVDLTCENVSIKLKDIAPTTKKIGFLGLGRIGQRIVRNLLLSGHSVTVWNRLSEKCDKFVKAEHSDETCGEISGAELAQTPSDVIAACDITFCCVSDPSVSKDLVFGRWGVLVGLQSPLPSIEKKGFVELTCLDPLTSHTIGLEVTQKGGRYLEAQIEGTRGEASEGGLHILAAGDRSLYDDCFSCFSAVSESHVFVSPEVGVASKYNIIHNMLTGNVYAALAECLALVDRVGLDQLDFLNILRFGELNNPVILEKGHCMVTNDYKSDTPLKHVQKNLKFALMLGCAKQHMPITAAANEIYKHCKLLRYEDHDVSAIYEGTRR